MIERHTKQKIEAALQRQAVVALLGPRQVGKTTLALEIAALQPSIYLDLEKSSDRQKLTNPHLFLSKHADKLVVLDEIHRVPDLFNELRGIVDEGRRNGNGIGRFLILGSASMDLMRQSETLAGRIAFVDMPPLSIVDNEGDFDTETLWVRGGYPSSLLAVDDQASFENRLDFIRSYLERDVPMFAPRLPADTVGTLWEMLAHNQGGTLNTATLAGSLQVSKPAVKRYLGLLTDLLLVRQLRPYFKNTQKRLAKSPKVYIRDSGLVHALLRINSFDVLSGHPIIGNSWEGFVVESLLNASPRTATASFYRSAAGAEIDLVLDLGPEHGTWAIEVKYSEAPKLTRGNHSALEDIQPSRSFVVYSGKDRYPKAENVEVIGLKDMVHKLLSIT